MATLSPISAPTRPLIDESDAAATDTKTLVRRWLGLAVGSLLLAGLLAIVLVIGRLPPLDALFTDPLLFKRALVVHVDLAIVVWFLSFFGVLWALLPTTARQASPLARLSPYLVLGGIGLLLSTALIPGVEPVLANYVPVLDDPLYMVGLALIGLGVFALLMDSRLLVSREAAHGFLPPEARPGLRAAAAAFLMALLTLVASALTTPHDLATPVYYEHLVWGLGHILQFVSVAAMVAVWLALLTPLTGPPLSRRVTAVLFGLLVLPTMVAPLMGDTQNPDSRIFFTRLMELGIFPIVTIFLVACITALIRKRAPLGDARVLGFLASAALAVTGFLLGASIDGSNTMVPAHYHASIGAVTAAFMAITYPLLKHLGLTLGPRTQRWSRWQPVLFGFGQLAFAIGFGIAGMAGALRKTYGTEQAALEGSFAQTLGLVVMGIGGLIAVVAGILYLSFVIAAWRSSRPIARRPLVRGESQNV